MWLQLCFLSALLCRLWLWGGLFGVGGVKTVEFVIDVVIVGVIFVVCVAVVVGEVVVVVVVVVAVVVVVVDVLVVVFAGLASKNFCRCSSSITFSLSLS